MHRKHLLLLFLFSCSITTGFCQEHETVLTLPENWKSEIIPFPLGFAQDIDLEGFEDLRFAPNWSDSTSENFWTYMFVWYIEKESAMTENKLTAYFNSYYDGLMGVNFKNREGVINPNNLDKTICLFIKTNEGFTGKMRVYDKFFSKDYITLNAKVRESFCPKTNKQIILFEISPKEFGHEVWNIFEDVQLKVKCK
ncbi:MAG: hypothetical protein D8M58_11145 [Calditrichaeota bacterium]|nr:MAG: hypothetical protein DWQ03_10520 [Calditrichota bacterium]MBL1205949.1 hypothetical protein [Calditrichota bacterium]NOG45777.1 hypothetical protein [Calditrichota bacterium]